MRTNEVTNARSRFKMTNRMNNIFGFILGIKCAR